MKKKVTISILTTVLDAVFLLFAILGLSLVAYLLNGSDALFITAADLINGITPESITGGYEILAGLGIGLLGSLGYGMVAVLIATVLFVVAFMLPCIITGLISVIRYRKKGKGVFLADSIVKLISNGLLSCLCLTVWGKEREIWLAIAVIPLLDFILCIIAISIKPEYSVRNKSPKCIFTYESDVICKGQVVTEGYGILEYLLWKYREDDKIYISVAKDEKPYSMAPPFTQDERNMQIFPKMDKTTEVSDQFSYFKMSEEIIKAEVIRAYRMLSAIEAK